MFVVLTEKIIGGISAMKKKVLSFLLILLLIVGLMPQGVFAQETFTTVAEGKINPELAHLGLTCETWSQLVIRQKGGRGIAKIIFSH